MSLLKTKKKRDWCPGGGEQVSNTWNKETRKNPQLKTKFIRCRVCNQRFEQKNRECDDVGCVHSYVPKHKAY